MPANKFNRSIDLLFGCATLALVFLTAACADSDNRSAAREGKIAMTIQLTSSAFAEGQSIPEKYTCDGADISPPLKWTNVPTGAKSLALICDDPDAPAGTWVHWVLHDLPPAVTELPEQIPTTETIPNGARQGVNDFKRIGYGGPCPPRGGPHRYFFKLYALDAELQLKAKVTKKELVRAMEGHILAEGQLMGRYKRK
ncbi:MAG: YbhB/YbcL family Raf kinase inhibitor-like protein [Blastocatellia bacterium]